jgi:hypothetical protein
VLFVTIVFVSQSIATGGEMTKQQWRLRRAWLSTAGAILTLATMATWGVNRNEARSAAVPTAMERPQATAKPASPHLLELLHDRQWNSAALAGVEDPGDQLFDQWFAEEMRRDQTEEFFTRVRQHQVDEEFRKQYDFGKDESAVLVRTW